MPRGELSQSLEAARRTKNKSHHTLHTNHRRFSGRTWILEGRTGLLYISDSISSSDSRPRGEPAIAKLVSRQRSDPRVRQEERLSVPRAKKKETSHLLHLLTIRALPIGPTGSSGPMRNTTYRTDHGTGVTLCGLVLSPRGIGSSWRLLDMG